MPMYTFRDGRTTVTVSLKEAVDVPYYPPAPKEEARPKNPRREKQRAAKRARKRTKQAGSC